MTKTRSIQAFASIGVDVGKDVMHIVGFDRRGAIAGAQPPEVLLAALEQLHAAA